MARKISMGARREVVSAVTEQYQSAKRAEKGRILDALCATTGWHRKHAVRALRPRETVGPVEAPQERKRRYGATVKDAMTALWEASDRVCGKRLKVMIPTLLPALEQHGRLRLDQADRDRVLAISAATIDRLLVDVKIAASGGRRRRAGFYSAIRREVPIRTFNDWNSPVPGFCEVDMVAHGGTSVAGSFIQTLTMVDVATGWTECLPLLTRESSLVVEAIKRRPHSITFADIFLWITFVDQCLIHPVKAVARTAEIERIAVGNVTHRIAKLEKHFGKLFQNDFGDHSHRLGRVKKSRNGVLSVRGSALAELFVVIEQLYRRAFDEPFEPVDIMHLKSTVLCRFPQEKWREQDRKKWREQDGVTGWRVYPTGRSNDWVKKTCAQRETLTIAGFALDGTKWDGLYVGRRRGPDLVYAGKVDHGFDKASTAELRRRLEPLIRKTQPYAKRIAHRGIWVEPKLLAEVEYRAKSAEGKVRHPFFKGLRDDL